MPTSGEASLLHANINTYVGLAFVAAFSFGIGLILWHAFNGNNPIADMLLSTAVANSNSY